MKILLKKPPGGGRKTVITITFCKIFIFMSLLFGCFIPCAFSENYYADADNGNDSWDGKAPTFEGGSRGPWKTGIKKGLVAGDVMAFKSGCTGIYSTRYVHYSSSGGTEQNPITIESYGEGIKPILCAATVIPTGDWADLGDGRYSKVTNRRCAVLLEDLIGIDSASSTALTDGYWVYSSGTIYYRPSSGKLSDHDIRFIDSDGGNTVYFSLYEAASYFIIKDVILIGNIIMSYGNTDARLAHNLTIKNVDFKYTPANAVEIHAVGTVEALRIGHDITVEDCTFTNCLNNMYFIGQNRGGFERIIIRRNKFINSNMMAGIKSWDWSGGGDRDGISAQNFKDCIIEYNEITGGLCHKGGGINIWQDSAYYGTGNIIRNNFIYDIVGGGIIWGGGDSGRCNAQIYNNIVSKSGVNKTYPATWDNAYIWSTIWEATKQTGNSSWGWAYSSPARNFRVHIKAGSITDDASVIRIGLKGNTAYASGINSMYIGEKKNSSDPYDFNAAPSQVKKGGSGSFSVPRYSDIVYTDPLSFSIDETKDYIVDFYMGINCYTAKLTAASTQLWYKDTTDESSTQDVSDYSTLSEIRNIATIDTGTLLSNIKSTFISTRVIKVYENTTELTSQSSIQDVEDNAGSWYWDGSLLYVRGTSGIPGSNGKTYLVRHIYNFPDGAAGGITLNRVQDNNPASGVYNNTVYNCNVNYHINFGDYFLLKNNISLEPLDYHIKAFNGIQNNTFSNNSYYPTTDKKFSILSVDKTWAEWQTAAGESNSITNNPKIISAGGRDFRLNTDSPCIKAGSNVGIPNDYFGNRFREPPSMGAIEYYKISGVISPRTIGGIKHMPK